MNDQLWSAYDEMVAALGPVVGLDVLDAACGLGLYTCELLARGAQAFTEFYRVLRPAGAVVISTGHPFTDWLRKGGSYFEANLETDMWPAPSMRDRFPDDYEELNKEPGFLILRLIKLDGCGAY